jgi:predicted outer membrane protein
MLLGALGAAAAPALAQDRFGAPMGPMGPAERRHAMDTLMVGNVALQTSELALSRAARPQVRQFAELEAEEQRTVAQIINEMTGGAMPPPPPSPADARMMASLQRARGGQFDRMYLVGQVDGHRRLLDIQERYLRDGRNLHHRHIAMLARGRIQEHLRDLQRLDRL